VAHKARTQLKFDRRHQKARVARAVVPARRTVATKDWSSSTGPPCSWLVAALRKVKGSGLTVAGLRLLDIATGDGSLANLAILD